MQWKRKNNSSRKREIKKKNEEIFEDVFNIAHANAMELMSIAEDKAFLLAQREEGRHGSLSSADNVLFKKLRNKKKSGYF